MTKTIRTTNIETFERKVKIMMVLLFILVMVCMITNSTIYPNQEITEMGYIFGGMLVATPIVFILGVEHDER